jgi:hypothetical protein
MLIKGDNKYSFCFISGMRGNDREITCSFIDETTENQSLKNFFFGLQDVNISKTKTNDASRTLKKVKKAVES